ncbi:MAG: ABC transporter ATP-binding protein [Planctomycetota bacterium]|nr:ABC transporter ATP-binding protein [Planctomycetota bacterium]
MALRGVSKVFTSRHGGRVEALKDINLAISPGEFVSVVGGSGCGKSTLLRIIAGLEGVSSGEALLDGQPINRAGLDRGMVFQEHRLLPWLNVWDNVLFALPDPRGPAARELVDEHLELVGLKPFASAYPNQLSGGMSQRVAIARALVNRPGILLLDEPFGALDALTRIQLQQEILRIWQAERATMVLVTHDIDEAVFLGDRVVVLSNRPGTVKEEIPVPLARPRQRGGNDFSAIRRKVYRHFFLEEENAPEYMV